MRATLTALLLLLAAAPALAGIAVEDAYAISPLPGAPTGAAYMLLRNDGEEPDRLLDVRSPAADSVALHGTAELDGVLRMRPLEGGLDLPPGGDLRLERGGPHVMFMGLRQPFEDGAAIPLTLVFERAGEMEVEVPVDLARLTGGAGTAAGAAPGARAMHGAAPEGSGHDGH